MLLDAYRDDLGDVQLLDDAGRGLDRREVVPAGGAAVEMIVVKSAVDPLGWEREALVFGMPGLSTDMQFVLSLRRWWFGEHRVGFAGRRVAFAIVDNSPTRVSESFRRAWSRFYPPSHRRHYP
ncbi:hypothetical protein BH23PLA1_BH23PLA1_43540 [soil metagenome]